MVASNGRQVFALDSSVREKHRIILPFRFGDELDVEWVVGTAAFYED